MTVTERNAPCPCGSGKKYKQCCMRQEQARAAGGHSERGVRREAMTCLESGNACYLSRRWDEAVAWYQRAISLDPGFVDAHYNLGNLLQRMSRLNEAEACFKTAISLKPDLALAHNSLGVVFKEQGREEAAAACYHKAIALDPALADAYINLGVLLRGRGQLDEAIASYRKAIALRPDYAEAYSNLGFVLQKKGNPKDAIASYRKALSLKPDFAEAYNNLGGVMQSQAWFNEAMENYRKAIALKPDYAEAYNNIGSILQDQCRLDEAIASFRQAIKFRPSYSEAYSNLLYCMNYHPDMTAEAIYAEYQRWNDLYARPLIRETRHANDRTPGRRLRIGYVSSDFRKHAACNFIEPLLAQHDKAAVEIYAYAHMVTEDEVSARMRGYIDHWRNIIGLNDEGLAQLVRRDGIDILVDLAGHTRDNRLLAFARQPAPIQVSWMGYGYTTGLGAMNYFLGDAEFTPPGCDPLFSEKIVRLPVFAAYQPSEGMGEPGPLPALREKRITFGTLSRSVRINYRVIRVWSAILQRVAGSRLIINSWHLRTADLRAGIVAQFAAHGVEPERLALGYDSPPWDVLRAMDIGLDCFPHNSGTTLFESLYMGVPYVTLAGRPSVGRIGAALLKGAGCPEWIAATEEEYIDKAVAMAGNVEQLALIREELRGRMQAGPVMDGPGFVRSVEAAYRDMWREWCGRE